MYITGIIQYLIWPAFIVLSWYAVKIALDIYHKKFPEDRV
jgi:hypothetical protein